MKLLNYFFYVLFSFSFLLNCAQNVINLGNNDQDKEKEKNNLILLGLLILSQDQAITSYTGSMNKVRSSMYSTLLSNGNVLIIGDGAELYNPDTGMFTTIDSVTTNTGSYGKLITLSNGKTLHVCGYEVNTGEYITPELFDTKTNTFTKTGGMVTSRVLCNAVLLNNGKVLVAGGIDSSGNVLSSAELYDPDTGIFSSTGSMNAARRIGIFTGGSRFILLEDGKVLVTNGDGTNLDGSGENYVTTIDIYDPGTGSFSSAGTTYKYALYSIDNNRVLFKSNESSSDYYSLLIYDVSTGEFSDTGQSIINGAPSIKLNNSKILFVGGGIIHSDNDNNEPNSILSIFDPDAMKLSNIGKMHEKRFFSELIVMKDGKVLIAGGASSINGYTLEMKKLSTAEIYSP